MAGRRHHEGMSEEPDNSTSATAPVVVTAPPATPAPPAPARHSRVTQVAAWVGIVAGVTFVVAVVFFSGFVLGKSSGGGGHHRGPDREMTMFQRGGPPMGPPHIFFPGGSGGPGFGPDGPGFGSGPQQGERPGPPNAPVGPARP
jgi:hypothetical protein